VTLIYLVSYSLWIIWLIVLALRLLLLNQKKLQGLIAVETEAEVASYAAIGRN
jgi:hypothetical protein